MSRGFYWVATLMFLTMVFFFVRSGKQITAYEQHNQYAGTIIEKSNDGNSAFRVRFDNGATEYIPEVESMTHSKAVVGQRAYIRVDHVPGQGVYYPYAMRSVLLVVLVLFNGTFLMHIIYVAIKH